MINNAVRILDALERSVLLVRPFERKKPNLLELVAETKRDVEGVRLNEARPLDDKAVHYFCGLNLAALVMYYTGDYARAAAICRREIDTCARLVADGCSVHWAFFAVEATLNIARLDALLGDRHAAVAQCRELLRFAFQKGRLTLGDRTVTRADLESAPTEQEENRKGLLRRLNAIGGMAVWEANKAFLLAADYGGLLQFLDDPAVGALAANRVVASALLEARVKALAGLGRHGEAAEALSDLQGLLEQDAAALRRSTLLAAQLQLDRDELEASLASAARCLDGLDRQGRPQVEVWYLHYRAALIHMMAGDAARAAELGRLALAQSTGMGEQVAAIKTICLLLQSPPACPGSRRDVQALCERLDEEAARCHYVAEGALAYAELGWACRELGQSGAARSVSCLARAAARARLLPRSPLEEHVTGRCREVPPDSRTSFIESLRHERVEELFRIALETHAFVTRLEPPAVAPLTALAKEPPDVIVCTHSGRPS